MKYTICARVLGVAAVATVLACCASNPVPNEKIAVAKSSVQRAEQAGAPESAPVEMAAARDGLARAESCGRPRCRPRPLVRRSPLRWHAAQQCALFELPDRRGKAYPVASNDDSGGRQRNRRVEVVIGGENGLPIAHR